MVIIAPELLHGLAHPTLMEVLEDVIFLLGAVRVTSFHRPDNLGVHGTFPCRAIDLRSRSAHIAEATANVVNDTWTYDPARRNKKVAIAHDVGGGMHLHLQVHDNTIRKEP